MPIIPITITNKKPVLTGLSEIVCGNSNYSIKLTLDSEWDAYTTKTAKYRFYSRTTGNFREVSVLFQGDSVDVPTLPTTTALQVMIYAGDIHTSYPANIVCIGESEVHDVPSQDVYEQLLEYLASLQGGGGSGTGIAELNFIGTDNSETGISEPEEELSAMYLNAPLAMFSMDSPDISLSEPDEIKPQVEEMEGI